MYPIGMTRATLVICERVIERPLYFSLEGYGISKDDRSSMFHCSIPFILSKRIIPVGKGKDNYRFLSIKVIAYFYPSRLDSMTLEYDLGYFDVNLGKRVDIGALTRLWSAVNDTSHLKMFILPGFFYRGQFHSKGRFTLGEEPEGSVCECIRAIFSEMESKR